MHTRLYAHFFIAVVLPGIVILEFFFPEVLLHALFTHRAYAIIANILSVKSSIGGTKEYLAVNKPDSNGNSLLGKTVNLLAKTNFSGPELQFFHILLTHGADPDDRDAQNLTAVEVLYHHSLACQSLTPLALELRDQIAYALYIHGANFNRAINICTCRSRRNKAKILACEYQYPLLFAAGLSQLLRQPKQKRMPPPNNQTRSWDFLEALLSQPLINVNIRDPQTNQTLLHMAAERGSLELVKILLKNFRRTIDLNPVDIRCDPKMEFECEYYTPLLLALDKQQFSVATYLVKKSANTDIESRNGWKPLHYSTYHNITKLTLRLLKSSKVNVDPLTKTKDTPLHFASQNGAVGIVQQLLARGANVNSHTGGWTALHSAAQNNHLSTCLLLLEHGADIDAAIPWLNFEDGVKEGKCPVVIAYVNNNTEIAEMLLERHANPNCLFEDGTSLLMMAAQRADKHMTEQLLKHGASINYALSTGETALHIAAQYNRSSVVQTLVSHPDIDLNSILTDMNVTTLHISCQFGYSEISSILISHSKVNLFVPESKKGWTPLLYVVARGDIPTVTLILQRSPASEVTSMVNWALKDSGLTALFYAVQQRSMPLVELLLRYGADVNLASRYNWTVLHHAAYTQDIDMATYLLSRGADPNVPLTRIQPPKEQGPLTDWSAFSLWSALHLAVHRSSLPFVELLLRHHADVCLRTADGYTAVELAKRMSLKQDRGVEEADKIIDNDELVTIIELLNKARPDPCSNEVSTSPAADIGDESNACLPPEKVEAEHFSADIVEGTQLFETAVEEVDSRVVSEDEEGFVF